MAFTNIRSHPIGGGLRYIFGDYTNTAGSGGQTYAVGAGRVLLVQVNPQSTGEPNDYATDAYSVSTSSGIITLTIYAQAGVTAGTFLLLVDAGG